MFDRWLKKRALFCALKKLTPGRFSLSEENLKNIDYFTFILKRDGENPVNMLAESIEHGRIKGRQWNGRSYADEKAVEISKLNEFTVEITHHFRNLRIKYSKATDFIWGTLSFGARRAIAKERLQQNRYNSQLQFRHDRIDILKALVEMHFDEAERGNLDFHFNQHYSSDELFIRIYGQRAYGHPDFQRETARFDMILNSLSHSEELDKNQAGYMVGTKALQTLSEYEEQEQRHVGQARHNRYIVILTIVLAVVGIINIFQTWFVIP